MLRPYSSSKYPNLRPFDAHSVCSMLVSPCLVSPSSRTFESSHTVLTSMNWESGASSLLPELMIFR